MDFKNTIEAAGKVLKDSELGQLSAIIRSWNDIEWNQIQQTTGQGASVNELDFKSINLFSDLAKLSQSAQQAAVLREFGLSLYRRFADARAKRRWKLKLTLPEAAQIDEVQLRLKDPKYTTYRQIMESFKSLMDRFVCLNLTNALLANGIKRDDAYNVNLRQWGSTLEYANVRKMHSLKAFVTAYGPRDVAECPGRGLAEKLIHRMGHVSESSLANAYGRLILEVFRLCQEV